MDLTTTYLGLPLAHPFIVGASPLADDIDSARRFEDGGAAAIVVRSLFEEQITMTLRGEIHHRDVNESPLAAGIAEFPSAEQYTLSVEGYAEHIAALKAALGIPVIASLNGTTSEEWMRVAVQMQQAGADALEVNIYDIVANPARSAMAIESDLGLMVGDLKRSLTIPVAVKLSPFYTALGNVAQRLDRAGVNGLVLFNRFYQPDIDLATLKVTPRLELSSSAELRLRLQWIALLHRRVKASLALTGGVATPDDGVKAILAGADAVQLVSMPLRDGPACFGAIRERLTQFMQQHGFASVAAMKGRVSLADVADPVAFQRAHYIRTLQSWRSPPRT